MLRAILTGLCRNIGPVLRTSVHVVVIVHLIKLSGVGPSALDCSVDMAILHQRFPNLGIGVRLRGARHDACIIEECVGVQHGEQLECLLEEVNDLLCRHVVGVARCIEGADARSVLAPFMLPERLVIAPIILPVYGHVV